MAINKQASQDQRIPRYIEAVERLKGGHYDIDVPVTPTDGLGQLGQALRGLAHSLETRSRELQKLAEITTRINAGLLLDDILESVYQDFREIIPYNRIGFSLLEEDNQTVRVQSCWAKSDQPVVKLTKGYSAPLAGSSLETIINTGQPRIINNLLKYLEKKPDSASTRLIVAEGMRSSLTCPLVANGTPVGFTFFSSIEPGTYADVHVDTFKRIAGQLSVIVEKGRLTSELAAQKAAIEQQNEELHRLNELKNTFLDIAAHDLRGPIGVIQMAAYFLLMDAASQLPKSEVKSFLNDISDQTHYMLALLDDLLDVTQVETGRLKLNLGPVEMNNFLTEAVKRHAKMAAPKETQVLLKLGPAGSVMADPIRLRQVIDNLISNAVKYSPPGSTVKVGVQRTQSEWRVNVQDEGPGLTSEDRERLFQDFARLSAKPTGGEKSVGLGLAITRRVVEAHGGQVGVDSVPGQGANFWFTLPD